MCAALRLRSKREHLEALFRRYPDVPPEVTLKEDILNDGQAFTEAALKFCESYQTKAYFQFTHDRVSPDTMQRNEPFRVPDSLWLRGGPYNLRGRLKVRVSINPDSPYVVDVVDGELVLGEREGDKTVPLAQTHDLPPKPLYHAKRLPDGTTYREVCPNGSEPHIACFHLCQHWGPKEECKYCDINENARLSRKRGALTMSRAYKKVEHVAEVVEEVFLREPWPRPELRPRYVFLTGGTITTKLRGRDEVAFFEEYIAAVRQRIGYRWPIMLAAHSHTKEEVRRWREAGLTNHSAGIEVWDERLFAILCPGKERLIGRDAFIRRAIEEVDVLGEGHVRCQFVAGVEMARPWGFTDIASAVKSTTEGFDYLMAHGVIPSPVHWCPEPHSALGNQPCPPVDYYILINQAWYELWKKYRLPPMWGMEPMGPGQSSFGYSAVLDMGAWA